MVDLQLGIFALALTLLALYLIIRWGVRDGIVAAHGIIKSDEKNTQETSV